MRYVYLVLIVILLALFVAFAVVNREPIRVNFPLTQIQLTAPQFLVMLGIYILGMFTGGSFLGFVRHSIERASEHREK